MKGGNSPPPPHTHTFWHNRRHQNSRQCQAKLQLASNRNQILGQSDNQKLKSAEFRCPYLPRRLVNMEFFCFWTVVVFTSFSAGRFTFRNSLNEKTGNPVHWPTSDTLNHQFLYLESGTNDDFHFSPNHKSSRLENITRGLLQQNAQIIQWSRKSLVLCELLSATKEIYRSSTVWKKYNGCRVKQSDWCFK